MKERNMVKKSRTSSFGVSGRVLIIRDELEEKFREAVFKRYGMKKGNLTKAIEEALELWITSGNKNTTRETHMRQRIYEGKKHG
jgi:hypothetical protein